MRERAEREEEVVEGDKGPVYARRRQGGGRQKRVKGRRKKLHIVI